MTDEADTPPEEPKGELCQLDLKIPAGCDPKKAIEETLQKMYPDHKIAFADDFAMPSELEAELAAYDQACQESLKNGTCVDCGAELPGGPPPEGVSPLDPSWTPLADWSVIADLSGGPVAFICPDCSDELEKLTETKE